MRAYNTLINAALSRTRGYTVVYAIQIEVSGGWRTVSTYGAQSAAEGHRARKANAYGCRARVKAFESEPAAWK